MHSSTWTIEEMAKVLNVSRSGYYGYCKRLPSERQQENESILQAIWLIFKNSRETYGSPLIHAELLAQGFSCSRPQVARLMKKAGIMIKMQRLFKTTTRRDANALAAPNLLQQDFSARAPNEKWVADMSYVRTLEGWLYIAVVLDLFSRKIVGLSMGNSLNMQLVIDALKQALQRRHPKEGLQHHSDQGCQYMSQSFQDLLKARGIVCSMSGVDNCYDNAAMESFFHTLKTECVYLERYENREQAKQSIFEYTEVFYNNQRRHSTLGYVSPAEFERRFYQQSLCS